MTFIEKILCRLFDHVDIVKQVGGEQVVYLRRWFVANTRWGAVYLHHIFRSDDDKDPHDHPWDFRTLILVGGYDDETYLWHPGYGSLTELPSRPSRRFFRKAVRMRPGTLGRRAAEHIHQVKLLDDRPAWTLVFTGLRRRDWCFVTEVGPVPWREYLDVWGEDPYDRVGSSPDYLKGQP